MSSSLPMMPEYHSTTVAGHGDGRTRLLTMWSVGHSNQNARGGWAPHSAPAAGRPGGCDLARWRSRVKLYQLVAANGRNGWEVAVRLNGQNEHVATEVSHSEVHLGTTGTGPAADRQLSAVEVRKRTCAALQRVVWM